MDLLTSIFAAPSSNLLTSLSENFTTAEYLYPFFSLPHQAKVTYRRPKYTTA
jgi:hypothetical protein